MFRYADVLNVFKSYAIAGDISKMTAAEMFVDILSALEWLDEDFNKGRIRTRVVKNREESVLGVGDVLNYDLQTGRIKPEVSRF